MYWELDADEALIIEFDAHDGLWTLTNMGVFFNSMDYLYRPVSYTPSRTVVDGDGRIRVVLAHDDPGCHNWLDTQGFTRGNVTYRHLLAGQPATADPCGGAGRPGPRATGRHGDRHPAATYRPDVGPVQRNPAAPPDVTPIGRTRLKPIGRTRPAPARAPAPHPPDPSWPS